MFELLRGLLFLDKSRFEFDRNGGVKIWSVRVLFI